METTTERPSVKLQRHKTVCYLTEKQLKQMDLMDRDTMFSSGGRLFKTTIIGLLSEILVRVNFRAEGIRSSDEFYLRFQNELNRHINRVLNGPGS